MDGPIARTERLNLYPWLERHRARFIAMHRDAVVMADQAGPMSHADADAKFDRYQSAFAEQGVTRWAVEDKSGNFLGYSGILRISNPAHPIGAHDEIGWRMFSEYWGQGLATEAARVALSDGFSRLGVASILSYTTAENRRSQSVMNKLGMSRHSEKDFEVRYLGVVFQCLTWLAQRIQ